MKKHPLFFLKKNEQIDSRLVEEVDFSPLSKECIVKTTTTCPQVEKMGLLILSGGQGTRLGFEGAKGCFELPLKPKKTLFQILLEKIQKKGGSLSVAIMTSPLNHQQIDSYLRANRWFGLNREHLDLFKQELIPMCDDQGELFFDAPDQIALAPAGNGKALFHLRARPIWMKWRKKGIEYVQVIPVDNVLAEPFDGELLACHKIEKVDLVLRGVERLSAQEELGIIGMKQGRLVIREYTEVSERIKSKRVGGKLTYFLGNSALFSCSMDWVEQLFKNGFDLPWHLSCKKKTKLIPTERGWEQKKSYSWGFETFIFDLFPRAKSFKVIITDRINYFAPLKNLFGSNSLETVLNALRSKKS